MLLYLTCAYYSIVVLKDDLDLHAYSSISVEIGTAAAMIDLSVNQSILTKNDVEKCRYNSNGNDQTEHTHIVHCEYRCSITSVNLETGRLHTMVLP